MVNNFTLYPKERPMKKLRYCALLLLLLALTLSAEVRTWTAKTGQTIDGEFAALADGTVSIKLPNGSTAQIKLDMLSDGKSVLPLKIQRFIFGEKKGCT